jgi:hypothetical protein
MDMNRTGSMHIDNYHSVDNLAHGITVLTTVHRDENDLRTLSLPRPLGFCSAVHGEYLRSNFGGRHCQI